MSEGSPPAHLRGDPSLVESMLVRSGHARGAPAYRPGSCRRTWPSRAPLMLSSSTVQVPSSPFVTLSVTSFSATSLVASMPA